MEKNKENLVNDKSKNKLKNNIFKGTIIFFIIILITLFALFKVLAYVFDDNTNDYDLHGMKKPVIYLYPSKKSDINVKLEYKWEIFADYPKYDKWIKGWNVRAEPNGKLINIKDNKEYSYIFWEWYPEKEIKWDLSKGFVVKWENTIEFLQDKLSEFWLTPNEYNEFIVYWFPLMKNNKYNLIHFADKQYTDIAPLDITPKPDSILRVFMVYKPLQEYIEIEKQEIEEFNRKWFSVIEWWWTEVK